MSSPLKTFICYAHEDHEVVEGLKKQLAIFEKKALLHIWSDGKILAGEHWDKSIKTQLEQAELILLFISVDFINSDYIEKTELQAALQRHREGLATLIPIIVRPCHWEDYFDIGQFQALPAKARPILSSHFSHRDEAFFEISAGIKKTAEGLRDQKITAAAHAEAEALAQQEAAAAAARAASTADVKRRKDEASWKSTLELDTLDAYEAYLEDGYTLHQMEAHQRFEALAAAEAKRKAAQKAAAKAEAERQAAAEAQKSRMASLAAAEERLRREDPFYDLMIPIQGGSFDMGDTFGDGEETEKPVHRVTVRDFHLCKYPVTQSQWKAIMGDNPSHFKGDNLPVEQVSWDDVQAFLKKLNEKTGQAYRLPTEAEWEYAAKGGTLSKGFKFSGSNEIDEIAWHHKNSRSTIHPIGQKKPNEVDLYDMSGNVWEWCQDVWHGAYKRAPDNGSAWERGGDKASRVVRGGSWEADPDYCRATCRVGYDIDYQDIDLGFRLAW